MRFYVTPEDDQTWFPAADGLYYPGDSVVSVGESLRLGRLGRSEGRNQSQLLAMNAEPDSADLATRLRYAQRMLAAVGIPDRMAAAVASKMATFFAAGQNTSLVQLLDEVDNYVIEKVGAP